MIDSTRTFSKTNQMNIQSINIIKFYKIDCIKHFFIIYGLLSHKNTLYEIPSDIHS